jgi:hypothetical protein
MTPDLRQRLLDYARELVSAQVEAQQFLGGERTTITDRLVSLERRTRIVEDEVRDVWVRVWAEFTITQTADPNSEGVPFPNLTFSSPIFPVFTLYPGSNAFARKNQLDLFETWLDNAETLNPSQTGLLYPNTSVPLVLVQNGSSWSQSQFPPYGAVYPGFSPPPTGLYNPYRVGGPRQIFSEFSTLIQTVAVSASVRLYVRGHSWESLGDFERGGSVTPVKLTVRQVGTKENPTTPGTGIVTLVSLQDALVGYNGESFAFSATSTWPSSSLGPDVTETVGLIGFEPR